jgi:hypothetical protein
MPDIPPIQSTISYRAPKIGTKHLSIVVIGLVVIVALLKARKEDIPKIVEILAASSVFCAIGWTLAILFLLFAAVSIWILIRVYERELARVSKERDELQTKLLNR